MVKKKMTCCKFIKYAIAIVVHVLTICALIYNPPKTLCNDLTLGYLFVSFAIITNVIFHFFAMLVIDTIASVYEVYNENGVPNVTRNMEEGVVQSSSSNAQPQEESIHTIINHTMNDPHFISTFATWLTALIMSCLVLFIDIMYLTRDLTHSEWYYYTAMIFVIIYMGIISATLFISMIPYVCMNCKNRMSGRLPLMNSSEVH